MSPADQASRYVAKCPPAIDGQGGHKTAYSVVSAVAHGFALSEAEAWRVLSPWNAQCQPPWSERELRHKIQDAINKPHRLPRGHKISTWTFQSRSQNGSSPAQRTTARKIYELVPDDLPEAVPDGARELIRKLFNEGEGVRIARAKLDGDGKERPDGGGTCLSREQWLQKLDKHNGDPNGIFKSSDRTGIYIAINPYKVGCTKDADVTAFRHALFEFDKDLTCEEQLNLYTQMKLPAAAFIYSGGDSVHAWVRIDAQSRAEYDGRVAMIYDHFEAAGFHPDPQNKNPGRLSRLPNCQRFDRRQELLALNPSANFEEWQTQLLVQDLKPKRITDYAAIDLSDKTNVLLGEDWILRGGSCVISASSGVGKSTIELQMAYTFALGRSFFGIRPSRPLKSVIIQAENDDRDNARTALSVLKKLGVVAGSQEWNDANERVLIYDNFKCADAFIADASRIAEKDRPDLMWLDPAAAFVGDDITKQIVIAKFFRNGIHPIAKTHGFAWMVINHYTKPPGDSGARKGWTSSDQQYRGAGSYDLPGWARASVTITEVSDGLFTLRLSKRGPRAGMTHPDDAPTTIAWMRHAGGGEIYWEQVMPPDQPAESEPSKMEKSAADMLVLVPVTGEILKADLLDDARAAGFSKEKARTILERSLRPGRNGEPPMLVVNKVKRPGTNPAQMISRNKEAK